MSNLLDKASIILTPTAYNNGEALCVKPSDGSGDFDFSRNSAATRVNAQGLVENVQSLGSELVTNGDFSNGSANWNLGASWSIVNEKAVNNGASNSFLTQNSIIENGKSYLVSFEISDMTQGSLQLRFGSGAIVTESFTTNGTKTSYYVSSGTAINFYSVSGFDGSIDNVSVKEVIDNTNLPRINYEGFSYDGSGNIIPNSGCGSWLFESQSTNLITQSELFSGGSWGNYNSTTTDNQTTAPDGLLTASKFSGTSDVTAHTLYLNA